MPISFSYRLADPDRVTTSPPEPERPCPMCGEMSRASAVKCRFCREVLDETLKRGKTKRRRESSGGGSSSSGALDIGIGIVCMPLGIGPTVASYAGAADVPGGGRFYVFYGLGNGGFIQMCRRIIGLVRSDLAGLP
jgi:hypothetical protein